LIPLALVTGVLIGAGVLVALLVGTSGGGGGGGDTSTLAGYFQAINQVETEISTNYSTISQKYPQAFQDVQQTLDYLDESEQAWADGVTKMKAINPPPDAAQAHNGLADAADAVRKAFADLRTGAAGAKDATALETLLNGADTTAFDNFGTACKALQSLADSNKITVSLAC
jgi:hypothetical protein